MGSKVTDWLTTSTSGQGISVLLAAATAYTSGAMTWQAALAAAAGGIALIVFPQNQQLASVVQTTTLDVEKVVDAYRLGLSHGSTLLAALPAALPPAPVATPVPAAAPAPAPTPIPVLVVGHGATL